MLGVPVSALSSDKLLVQYQFVTAGTLRYPQELSEVLTTVELSLPVSLTLPDQRLLRGTAH